MVGHTILGSLGYLKVTVDIDPNLGRFDNWVISISNLRKDENHKADSKTNPFDCPESDRWAVKAIVGFELSQLKKAVSSEKSEIRREAISTLKVVELKGDVGVSVWRVKTNDVRVVTDYAKRLQKSLGVKELSFGELGQNRKRRGV